MKSAACSDDYLDNVTLLKETISYCNSILVSAKMIGVDGNSNGHI